MNQDSPLHESDSLLADPIRRTRSYDFRTILTGRIHRKYFVLLSLAIILLSTYLNYGSLNGQTVIDDNLLIYDAEGRGCGANPLDCFHGTIFAFYYRPILSASFALGQKFHGPPVWDGKSPWGTDVVWFHRENLILHAIVIALALCLFRLLFRRRITVLAAGLLFGVHPLQITITTFLGGRTDTIALFFVLIFAIALRKAGDLLSIRKADPPSVQSYPTDLHRVGERRSFNPGVRQTKLRVVASLWILVSLLAFLGGLFTKEQVFVLAALVPMLAAPHFRRQSASLRTQTPFPYWSYLYLIPIVIYVFAMHAATKKVIVPHADWTPGLHIEMIGRTIWYFVRVLFFPTLTTQHASTLGPWDVPQYGIALLGYVTALLSLGILLRTWSDRSLRILMLWTLLTLVSCINIIPIPSQFASPYRAAIPLFGIAGLAAALLTTFAASPDAVKASFQRALLPLQLTLILVATGWGIYISLIDVPYWHDEFKLMVAEVAADPNFLPARGALANDYTNSEKYQKYLDFKASEREYNACVKQLFGNASSDDYAKMIRTPQMARRLMSGSSLRYEWGWIITVFRGRGWLLASEGRYAEAIPDFRTMLIVTPDDEQTRDILRTCYLRTGQQKKADFVFRHEDMMGAGPP